MLIDSNYEKTSATLFLLDSKLKRKKSVCVCVCKGNFISLKIRLTQDHVTGV